MPSKPSNTTEIVEMTGHIVDSLLLPKVLDTILSRGGTYTIRELNVGQKQGDPSFAKIEIHAETPAALALILTEIHSHGAAPEKPQDCVLALADVAGAFPDGFYCSTNFRTEIRVAGTWIEVQWQEMDCGIVFNAATKTARCIPMTAPKLGDQIVIGHAGIRVFPPESEHRKANLFEFMASPVSSEKPKAVSVREIAAAMKRSKAAGEKILAVLGPAVVHTGGGELVAELIRNGYLNVLFAGNALATHDMEQAIYGTSLGVSFSHGLPTDEGHEHHLRTINTIRRHGGIRQAIAAGTITSGIMFEARVSVIFVGEVILPM